MGLMPETIISIQSVSRNMNYSQLFTEHLILRKARMDDLGAIWLNIWRDESIAKFMLWQPVATLKEAEELLIRIIAFQKEQHAFFVCLKETDEPIGMAAIKEVKPGIFEDAGLCIASCFQGRGYGKELLSALLHLSFDILGGTSFRYSCFRENVRSAALCKSCGFQYVSSSETIRQWDGRRFTSDHFVLDKSEKTIQS